jgi:L-ribulokinase
MLTTARQEENMAAQFALGIDFGTNSVRALVVNTHTGAEVGSHVYNYPSGADGIMLDARDPHLARQRPQDYLTGLEACVRGALRAAKGAKGFTPEGVVGIGVDTTGSTPLPVDADGTPLALHKEFAGNVNAMAWLWKDHTARAEAEEITAAAHAHEPDFTMWCGGTYSSEWFFSKVLHLARVDKKVFKAAASFVEHCDWIPALLCGDTAPRRLKRSICAAGHKAMFNKAAWGGLPPQSFWSKIDARLDGIVAKLYREAYTADTRVGGLCAAWARKLGLPAGIAVTVGAFDAHLGAVGSGIKPGVLVKILGTSTCDMMVFPETQQFGFIPGLCGIVHGSILPGHYGVEAGQSAVGDIFNWVVKQLVPAEAQKRAGGNIHGYLIEQGLRQKPGEHGLLALDWHNGNRTVLVDQNLTGLLVGLTLGTRVEDIYRACIEGTAFGARVIMERLAAHGVTAQSVVTCGGLAEKNPLLMQIYADVLGVPMRLSRSVQTCALGAAMCGAVAGGAHATLAAAQQAMGGLKTTQYKPKAANAAVYATLYQLYKKLHDVFGTRDASANCADVMKDLLRVRARAVTR